MTCIISSQVPSTPSSALRSDSAGGLGQREEPSFFPRLLSDSNMLPLPSRAKLLLTAAFSVSAPFSRRKFPSPPTSPRASSGISPHHDFYTWDRNYGIKAVRVGSRELVIPISGVLARISSRCSKNHRGAIHVRLRVLKVSIAL